MKKIVRLTENDLTNIVKRVISEIKTIRIEPFTLQIVDGNIRITNNTTKESRTYQLLKSGMIDIPLTVEDFPDGNKITISAMGTNKTDDLDKNVLSNILTDNWGINKKVIPYTTKKNVELKFKKL